MYASDYPHGESHFPETVKLAMAWDFPEARRRKLMWDNAVRLYARSRPGVTTAGVMRGAAEAPDRSAPRLRTSCVCLGTNGLVLGSMTQDIRGIASAACVLAMSCVSFSAFAQTDYPAKPVRVIVGQAPGGGNDIQTRLFAQKLSESLRALVPGREPHGRRQRSFVSHGRGRAARRLYAARRDRGGFTIAPAVYAHSATIRRRISPRSRSSCRPRSCCSRIRRCRCDREGADRARPSETGCTHSWLRRAGFFDASRVRALHDARPHRRHPRAL